MKRGLTQARQAVALVLAAASEPVTLFSVSATADHAARIAGRRTDLFRSLGEYACVLPAGWTTEWMNKSGSMFDDATLYAATAGKHGALKPTRIIPGAFDLALDLQGVSSRGTAA